MLILWCTIKQPKNYRIHSIHTLVEMESPFTLIASLPSKQSILHSLSVSCSLLISIIRIPSFRHPLTHQLIKAPSLTFFKTCHLFPTLLEKTTDIAVLQCSCHQTWQYCFLCLCSSFYVPPP